MIELSRAQDEEVGDGTTSVIILAGEMLTVRPRTATGRRMPGGAFAPDEPTVLMCGWFIAAPFVRHRTPRRDDNTRRPVP